MKKKKNSREHAKNPLLSCSPVLTRREVSLSLSLSFEFGKRLVLEGEGEGQALKPAGE